MKIIFLLIGNANWDDDDDDDVNPIIYNVVWYSVLKWSIAFIVVYFFFTFFLYIFEYQFHFMLKLNNLWHDLRANQCATQKSHFVHFVSLKGQNASKNPKDWRSGRCTRSISKATPPPSVAWAKEQKKNTSVSITITTILSNCTKRKQCIVRILIYIYDHQCCSAAGEEKLVVKISNWMPLNAVEQMSTWKNGTFSIVCAIALQNNRYNSHAIWPTGREMKWN